MLKQAGKWFLLLAVVVLVAAATQAIIDVRGIYNATAPNLTDGTKVQLQTDKNGNLYTNPGSPCNTPVTINLTASGRVVTGVSGQKVHICSIIYVLSPLVSVAMVEGTGSTCGTGTAGMEGGTTAATGFVFTNAGGAANTSGLSFGNGAGIVDQTTTNGDDVCFLLSGATQLSGKMMVGIY